jgi:hypothetical protein
VPPLPSLTQSALLDPSNKQKGEKLITKTFFSFGPAQQSPNQDDMAPNFLSIKERKVQSSLFSEEKNGTFELQKASPHQPDLLDKAFNRKEGGGNSSSMNSKRFSK